MNISDIETALCLNFSDQINHIKDEPFVFYELRLTELAVFIKSLIDEARRVA